MKKTYFGIYGIIRKGNRLLLIKKARGPYSGQFDLPGGGIEFGETPEQTLIRELEEETGLHVIANKLYTSASRCFKHSATPDRTVEHLHHIGFIYTVECSEYDCIKTEGDHLDSSGAFWFEPDAGGSNNLTPFAKRIVEEIFGVL